MLSRQFLGLPQGELTPIERNVAPSSTPQERSQHNAARSRPLNRRRKHPWHLVIQGHCDAQLTRCHLLHLLLAFPLQKSLDSSIVSRCAGGTLIEPCASGSSHWPDLLKISYCSAMCRLARRIREGLAGHEPSRMARIFLLSFFEAGGACRPVALGRRSTVSSIARST